MLQTKRRIDNNVNYTRKNGKNFIYIEKPKQDYLYNNFQNEEFNPYSNDINVNYCSSACEINTQFVKPFIPIEITDYLESKEKSSKKSKVIASLKLKVLISVYLVLVILIAAMLIINATIYSDTSTSISNEVLDTYNNSTISSTYIYDTSTNWFDNFCDYIGNIF